MINYIYESNILDSDAQVIVLVVPTSNCLKTCKKGKGLAASITERFPYADFYTNRKKDCVPGSIEMRGGKGIGRFVCAFYAQIRPGKPIEGSSEERSSGFSNERDREEKRIQYFAKCLIALGSVKNLREVAFPYKIGCGLAGGNWEKYLNMIKEFAISNKNVKVFIISQEPSPVRDEEKEDILLEEIELEKAFVKWICRQLKDDPERLRNEAPDLLLKLHEEYYNYLHNVEEDDEKISREENVSILEESQESKLNSDYTWETTMLEEYTEKNIPEGWEEFFTDQLDIETGSIHEISKYLFGESQKGEIYPELHLVYNIFSILKPEDIKVVIIGQDCYINAGEAMGISFSVPEGIDVPPSLRNIYKELQDDGFEVADHSSGDLTKWCEQGVFLINSALTVRAHESGSHSKKWNESFSPSLMRWLNENCNPLVIIMWGKHAQNFSNFFGDGHRKIMSVHPSPLSAHRGFFGSKPFSKTNKHLVALGYDPIDWSL